MKKTIILCLFLSFTSFLFGQVGIGTEVPDRSAVLDVDVSSLPNNNKKGMLFPNVMLKNNTDKETVLNPVVGLAVFNTADSEMGDSKVFKNTLYYWNGISWQDMTTMDVVRRELLPQVFLILGNATQVFDKGIFNSKEAMLVEYNSSDVKLNTGNRVSIDNNIFTINSTGKYDISGTINFNNSLANAATNSKYYTNLEFIVQKSEDGVTWENIAKSITAWGYGTGSNNRSMLISPTVLNFKSGEMIRCVIQKTLGDNVGTVAGGNIQISSPNGLGFSRVLRIQKID